MSEKAKELGIPETHITRALILARDLRIQAFREDLDPRATRIAIIYLDLCDLHFARQRLSSKELAALRVIAREYYEEVRPHDTPIRK